MKECKSLFEDKLLQEKCVFDCDGFRPNVGMVLCRPNKGLLWAKRQRMEAWQFPQGGIQGDESPKEAMFRELYEEVGLKPKHVEIKACTRAWHFYHTPHLRQKYPGAARFGQKQKWFFLKFIGQDSDIQLDYGQPGCDIEFSDWRWVPYGLPWREVVSFKRLVYYRVLHEFYSCYKSL